MGEIASKRTITHAAVIIHLRGRMRDVLIPCHRHADAFIILEEFGYIPSDLDHQYTRYGFLDSNGKFISRKEAFKVAVAAGQTEGKLILPTDTELYSEMLW